MVEQSGRGRVKTIATVLHLNASNKLIESNYNPLSKGRLVEIINLQFITLISSIAFNHCRYVKALPDEH